MRVFSALVLSCSIFVAGCGDTVQEDRAADWSADGKKVSFQHADEGVFVAARDGAGLVRIFEPDEKVLATSRPLHSPIDGRLIFTTAHDRNGLTRAQVNGNSPALPEGRIFWQYPVDFTCWLREDDDGDQSQRPRELFTASCEHIGYVAAGLAVRWHPDGKRVLFVDSGHNANSLHGVYEYDLATHEKRRVFPHLAEGMIFDFTPRGSRLVCVTGSRAAGARADGRAEWVSDVWIGVPDDEGSWWRPATGGGQGAEHPSLVEHLRARRPAWTADDARFASVLTVPGADPQEQATSKLQMTVLETRDTRTVYETRSQLTDLVWSPESARLGFVERPDDGNSRLQILNEEGKISEPFNSRPVRRIAGFNRSGNSLAYIVPDETGLRDESQAWALVLLPDRGARDAVLLADIGGTAPETKIFDGARVTFPLWSPTEDRLSLWITFVPRYRSLLSILRRWGLLPGDPAAILDPATGEVSWLAVTPQEQLQVGHYYLLKKDYARAWEWYERANQKLPARKSPSDWIEFTQAVGAPERSQLFEYLCLTGLGRREAARERLRDFERTFFPAGQTPAATSGDFLGQFGDDAALLTRLLHDFFAAEVFLSVDAHDQAIGFFRDAVDGDDFHRLSRALALSQVLLIAGRYDEYLTVCNEFVFPLALSVWGPDSAAPGQGHSVLTTFAGLCLAPLFCREFDEQLPEPALRGAIKYWAGLRDQLPKDAPTLAIDLCLLAAHRALGETEQADEATARVMSNPARAQVLGTEPLDQALSELLSRARGLVQF